MLPLSDFSPSFVNTGAAASTRTPLDNYEQITKFDAPPPPLPASVRNYGTASKKPVVKMEESRLMLEIRNSAPDVIIMTSHWCSCTLGHTPIKLRQKEIIPTKSLSDKQYQKEETLTHKLF